MPDTTVLRSDVSFVFGVELLSMIRQLSSKSKAKEATVSHTVRAGMYTGLFLVAS
ncbi:MULTISPECIES: hypothetical protein [unclassified Spirosoma]|uniref:hypothetical protein n=1 Tax=unclassified Spirosoma TaxID=2621999 RepID=UPI001ACDAFA2|nr:MULTISPECIES: hypothetical protein [unclassified Spirosoma]MBN8823126.1 hypothetical protein [Spirosoma sp.]